MRSTTLRLALLVLLGVGNARPQEQSSMTATSSTSEPAPPQPQTSFESTETNIRTTTIKAVTHPALVEPSVITMLTVRTITTYVPFPVTAYPAYVTKTVIYTDQIERRTTNSDGWHTTEWTSGAGSYGITSTVEDPNATTTDDYPTDFTWPPWPTWYPEPCTEADPSLCPETTTYEEPPVQTNPPQRRRGYWG